MFSLAHTAASPDEPYAEHILMETSENGSTIISDGTGTVRILDMGLSGGGTLTLASNLVNSLLEVRTPDSNDSCGCDESACEQSSAIALAPGQPAHIVLTIPDNDEAAKAGVG